MFRDRSCKLRSREFNAAKVGEHTLFTRGGQVTRVVKQIQHEVEYQQYKRRSSVRLHIRHAKFKRMQNYYE